MVRCQRILNFNIFQTNDEDAETLRLQCLSTRFYIAALFSSLFILTLYTSLQVITYQVRIDHPTLQWFEQMPQEYSVECACSEMSIPYEQIITLEPIYHPVCTSDFVRQEWINFLYDRTITPFYSILDFRRAATQQFQLLASLCHLSTQLVDNKLQAFLNTKFITDKLLNRSVLTTQMQAYIKTFKADTRQTFERTFTFVNELLFDNILLPATSTFYYLFLIDDTDGMWEIAMGISGFETPNDTHCLCTKLPACFHSASIYENSYISYIVHGWYVSCRPIDALLISTLQILFNQTNLQAILPKIRNYSINVTSLDLKQTTRFDPKITTVQMLVNEAFIDYWIDNINYSIYFDRCTPKSCTYTVNKRFNVFYVLTTIIGLYGGLSIVLRVLAPFLTKLIFRRKQQVVEAVTISTRAKNLVQGLRELNMFKSATKIQPNDIYMQKWSTRLYLLVLLVSLTIITFYMGVRVQTIQINLNKPLLDRILDLQNDGNAFSLDCPCSKIASPLKNFITIEPIYHEICSSDFISPSWISLLSLPPNYYYFDFRRTGPIFRLIHLLCDITNRTIISSKNQFLETQFVTKSLIEPAYFMAQTRSSITNFYRTIPNFINHPLQMMRETIRTNRFIASMTEDYSFVVKNITGHLEASTAVHDYYVGQNNVICGTLLYNNCSIFTILIDYFQSDGPTAYLIPGFLISSYYSESLLLSESECLYNQSCVDLITRISTEHTTENFQFKALSKQSRFSINDTFATLVQNLFVEQWNETFSYKAYFLQCEPHSCSYKLNGRLGLLAIFTSLVGFFGGLSTILRLLVPLFVQYVFKLVRRHSRPQVRNSHIGKKFAPTRLSVLWNKLIHAILSINFFENVDRPNPPPNILLHQLHTTRLYLIVLTLILSILAAFNLFDSQTNTITVNNPKFGYYADSQESLSCPCTNLSIPYSNFLQLTPYFHDVCSSQFIDPSSMWSNLFYESFLARYTSALNISIFRSTALLNYQSLRVMCETSIKAVNNELDLFLNSTLISAHVIDMNLFKKQINSTVVNFYSSTVLSNFVYSLNLLRAMYSGNSFMTQYLSNYYPTIVEEINYGSITFMSRQYNNSTCDCATSLTCVEPATEQLSSGIVWSIPGIFAGCTPLESMLQSTLECLYMQDCLDTISTLFQYSGRFIALSSGHTRFHPINSTKLEKVTSELFIENWSINISFEAYFNACQPAACSYTITTRLNAFSAFQILVSFYGGLNIILRLIVPFTIDMIHKYLVRLNAQVQSIS